MYSSSSSGTGHKPPSILGDETESSSSSSSSSTTLSSSSSSHSSSSSSSTYSSSSSSTTHSSSSSSTTLSSSSSSRSSSSSSTSRSSSSSSSSHSSSSSSHSSSTTSSSSSVPCDQIKWVDDVGLIVYQHFYSKYGTYLGRLDEAGLSITKELTFGCWVYFSLGSSGVEMGIISKWYTTLNQRSYMLYKDANDLFSFSTSTLGTVISKTITDTTALTADKFAEEKWFYVVGRFTPSVEIALFVNGKWYKNTTAVPASIFDSTASFDIGRYDEQYYLDGRMTHAFLCAYSVPDRFIESMYAHAKAMFMSR